MLSIDHPVHDRALFHPTNLSDAGQPIAVRNPLLVRMGVRNIARRPAQTALIVVGLMFATLLDAGSDAGGANTCCLQAR